MGPPTFWFLSVAVLEVSFFFGGGDWGGDAFIWGGAHNSYFRVELPGM